MNPNNFAIIMAGGVGSRFWPWSKTERPKQFLDVLGTGKTLIQQTFERINRICPSENILIITNQLYDKTIARQLPDLPPENILCEPSRRNTAPCIAYGAFKIKQKNPQANILVAPSDHIILKEDLFLEVVNQGFDYAGQHDALLTIGIKPHKPETGYGYVKSAGNVVMEKSGQWQLSGVERFTEKPDLATAQEFVQRGDYFWNAGIFIWSVSAILNSLDHLMPELYGQFKQYEDSFNTSGESSAIDSIYAVCDNISIDYGIMEKADNVWVISTDIGWSDLGSWSALQELSPADPQGNTSNSKKVLFYDSRNNLVRIAPDKVGVIQAMDNYIIIDDEKALLICKMDDEQKIKQFVQDVGNQLGKDFV
ncbi:MAG: mannose-1-phosphate guanylyltransferase [Candidatus Cyclobacteriaceae bacterium M3_2C_046]